jgi:MFS family permease
MGVATCSIGCLPAYAHAGAVAPVLLIALRFIQGLAIGGQWGGAVLLITEHVPEEKRGYYASFAQAGVPVGVLLANSAFLCAGLLTSPDDLKDWAWRAPFVMSIALVGLGIYVHLRAQDEFARPAHESGRPQRSPVLQALLRHPREIMLGAGMFLSTTLTFYVLLTFVLAYGTSTRGLQLPYSTMLSAVLAATVANLPATFLIGRLSDHLGRRRTVMLGAALCAVWAFTLFPLLNTRSFPLIVLTVFLGKLFSNMIYVPAAALVTGLFEKSVRCSASSLSYQLGSILGGGLAPVVATALYARFDSGLGVMVYISVASLVSLCCVAFIDEHRSTQ